MSSNLLHSTLRHISAWATENATWTGRLNDTSITLHSTHTLSEIAGLTLKLGGHASIALSTPQTNMTLHMGRCTCCFDLRTSANRVWCRFQACDQHTLDAEHIDTLLTRVLPSTKAQSNVHRLILLKSSDTFSFQKLSSALQHIELFSCSTEATLSIPSHISILNIVRSQDLVAIEGLDSNRQLTKLSITWCKRLSTISNIASNILQSIKIHWCQRLQHIPPLHQPTLKVLDIQACQSLKKLPPVHLCTHLEEIRFCWFSQDITLPSLADCQKLRFLILRSMSTMTALPDVCTERLELLDVAESTALQKITGMGQRLRILIADGCDKLETVDVTNSSNLQRLSLARVSELKEIHGLVENHSLQHLQISEAPTLSHLDGLETNFELRTLTLVNCPELTHLPNWRRLIQMTELTIYGCRTLTSLPQWHLPSLEVLKIGGCDGIQRMVPFSQFPNLQTLKWTSFKGLEETTDISDLIHLRELRITGHPSLRTIKGFNSVQGLETVDLSRCSKLISIEGLENSIGLRHIQFQGCRSLRRLPPLFQLEYLEELGLSHCSGLRRLDCIYLHPRLKLFNISHCPALERLPLLHPRTRASIRHLYCTHLPQPIDISKVVGGVPKARLKEIHVENSNVLSLQPLLNCNSLIEITGLEPVSRWKLLLSVAIERQDVDWIAEHWSVCIHHLDTHETDQMAMTCIEALKVYSTMQMLQQLFSKLRSIEHASTGDSLIPAPVWQHLFEWLFAQPMKLFKLFQPIVHRQTIKIDLMREENWFPVLIDICTKRSSSKEHAHLLETIYQQALFKNTPMYDHLRSKWMTQLQ